MLMRRPSFGSGGHRAGPLHAAGTGRGAAADHDPETGRIDDAVTALVCAAFRENRRRRCRLCLAAGVVLFTLFLADQRAAVSEGGLSALSGGLWPGMDGLSPMMPVIPARQR